MAFPSTGRQQQNTAAQHLALHSHIHQPCTGYLYTYKRKYTQQSGSATMPNKSYHAGIRLWMHVCAR